MGSQNMKSPIFFIWIQIYPYIINILLSIISINILLLLTVLLIIFWKKGHKIYIYKNS